MTLNDLKKNESGIITGIELDGAMKHRLAEMGITTGAKITMLRTAPMGDPIAFYILACTLCLRRKEARKIFIERVVDNNE